MNQVPLVRPLKMWRTIWKNMESLRVLCLPHLLCILTFQRWQNAVWIRYIAIFRHLLWKAVDEIRAVAYYINSGLQTRAAQASLLRNEKLFLIRLQATWSDLVSTTKRPNRFSFDLNCFCIYWRTAYSFHVIKCKVILWLCSTSHHNRYSFNEVKNLIFPQNHLFVFWVRGVASWTKYPHKTSWWTMSSRSVFSHEGRWVSDCPSGHCCVGAPNCSCLKYFTDCLIQIRFCSKY